MRPRVIPSLLLQDGGLVKTRRFEDPVYIGDPVNAIRIFNERQVDEMLLLGISRSTSRPVPDFATIERVAGECFMPLAYGGGITTVDEARRIFALGVEKVVIRSAANRDWSLLHQIAQLTGNQSVTYSIDLKRQGPGRYSVHAPQSPLHGSEDWRAHINTAIDYGAGEILLQSVDRDGGKSGFDLDMIRMASDGLSTPLVTAGGYRYLDDAREAIIAGATAVSAGAAFVLYGPHNAVLITYPSQAEMREGFCR